MRTTIDLPDDLHRIATSLARHDKRSLSEVVAELIRLGLEASDGRVAEPGSFYRIDEETGLPVVRSPRPITAEDVKALDDEW